MSAKIDRKKLQALLEEYGSSIAAFDALRADSYEKALIDSDPSFERLEQLYSEIFWPSQSADAARPKCPQWPPGSRFAGELPSLTTINNILARMRTDQTINGLGPIQAFLEQYRKSISKTPIGDNDQMTDTVIALAAQELIKAHHAGKPIDLDTLSRLQYEKRTKLKEREIANRERALDLLVKKYEDERERIRKVVADAKSSGGITPETLEKIERELKLL